MHRLPYLLLRRELPPVSIDIGQIRIDIAGHRKLYPLELHLRQREDVLFIEAALIEAGSKADPVLVIGIDHADKPAERYQQIEVDELNHLVRKMPH